MLEIWFVLPSEYEDDDLDLSDATATTKQPKSPLNPNTRYLLDISDEDWAEMLELVHCQIISKIENSSARAYLLSESSMFVHEYQIVIKTCGTTTLLRCIKKLLQLAATVGLTKVDNVFYNRQNFFFPDKQISPHQTFATECQTLDRYFSNGGAYTIGRINENHYNFYNAESRMARDDPAMLERD